jgi:hypothetical protein
MKYIGRLVLTVLIAVVLVLSYTVIVAAIDDPDDPPSIEETYVYENLREPGDLGVLMHYFIDYTIAGYPDETVTEAYLAVFVDTDGITQLASVAPYTFVDSGYGHGVVFIYFTAAEVTTYAIDAADEALYRVWIVGNPTLSWAADPPKTIGTIDEWYTVADPSTVFALRILNIADQLELQWGEDLIEVTSLGNRLTATGESYFENVVTDLREIAPSCFADSDVAPLKEDIDYSTEFGAIFDDLGGVAAGSPITLVEGANTVTVTALGTFTITLEPGTYGTATSGAACIVTGSPVDLIPGVNTITTTTNIGTITVTVDLETPQEELDETITGTAFDLSDAATAFGMSTVVFSGLVWMLITILIVAACYKIPNFPGKGVFLVFDISIIGGAVLGLLPILISVMMFIAFGLLTGYVLFYRGANF